ncbi:MAG: bifunctional folylpolyglutamate synthase/dihydrofolate synthase, partial [Alphaproteobacteria bacterium]
MSLHPKIIDLSLDRMERLLARLDHPERRLPPVIHIAGTNGKGSTLAMIRAGMEAAGQSCHVYTSPHLVRFHERIRLAGDLIPEPELMRVLERCEEANGGAPITYFEITTGAALLAFAETRADWTLLEVGLGGRLDATNVVDRPRLTIIAPVDYDHQQYLGEKLREIAAEKAGILKRGVPCIVGSQRPEGLEVIEERAAALDAPLKVCGRDWLVREERGRMVFEDDAGLLDLPLPRLRGAHQIRNAGAAIAALRLLGRGDAEAAVTRAEWPARLQRLRSGPLAALAPDLEIWLDGGHNPSAGKALGEALAAMPERPTWLICGMLDTKDVSGFLQPLAPLARGLYGVTIPETTATLSGEATAGAARAVGMTAQAAGSVPQALAAIERD